MAAKKDQSQDLKNVAKNKAQATIDKGTQTKKVESLKQEVKSNKPSKEKQTGGAGGGKQKEVACPFCGGHVKKRDTSGGRTELVIPFTNPAWRIPIPPFLANFLKPDPKSCSCEGKQQVKDVSDDSAKYQQVKQQAQSNIEKSIDLEAKMGTGGSRTTYIEKSDTLLVGLGFNRNDSYEVVPEGHLSPGKPQVPEKTKEFGTFAAGIKTNAVVGKQTSVGWPSAVGNYKIVCANSFNVVAGAGGINFNTKGPLTFNSGILNLTGPQVNVGSSSGPLTLEGDVVSITGKTITMTPTDANVFVKGTVSATGNMIVGGHLHAENLSFCKASCAAKDIQTSKNASNPDSTETFQAAWGGVGVKGITSSVLDIVTYFGNVFSDFETAAIDLLSPTQMLNLVNRMTTLTKVCIPIETIPTGIAIGLGVSIVYNWPHVHGLPSFNHAHSVRVPDIEYKDYSSPQSVRAAVINESLTSNAPVVKKTGVQEMIKYAMALPGFIVNTSMVALRAVRWIIQVFT
jgi:hypothetical protein